MEGNGVLTALLVVMSVALLVLLVVTIGMAIAIWKLVLQLRRTTDQLRNKAIPVVDELRDAAKAVRRTAEDIRTTTETATAVIHAGKALYDGIGIAKSAGKVVSSARGSGSGLLAGLRAGLGALFSGKEAAPEEEE
jgi:predicted PurR-regulated permease PerM